jgi:hypothetical protein
MDINKADAQVVTIALNKEGTRNRVAKPRDLVRYVVKPRVYLIIVPR